MSFLRSASGGISIKSLKQLSIGLTGMTRAGPRAFDPVMQAKSDVIEPRCPMKALAQRRGFLFGRRGLWAATARLAIAGDAVVSLRQ